MKVDEFITEIRREYIIIKVLATKDSKKSLLLQHHTLGKKLVLKACADYVPAYDFLKSIRHQNLPEVYDSFLLEDGFIVLEEYIDGLSVAEVLQSGLYTYRGAKKVITDICDALEILHSVGIVHRDIKPENVMVSSSGNVKLIDFDASRQISPKRQKDTVALGTIGYASPEQFGISQSDSRADIYALGVMLNVMLTGEHPSKKFAQGRAGKIVLKCTNIVPDLRYKSVLEVKAAL